MLYREKIAACCEIDAKHINALWAEHNFWMLKLVVHKVKFRLWKVNSQFHPKNSWLIVYLSWYAVLVPAFLSLAEVKIHSW